MINILVPTRDQPHPLTTQCLERITVPHKVIMVRGLALVEARNALVRMVLDEASDDDTVLMLDDDNYFDPKAVSALIESLTEPDQVISANVPPRWANAPPVGWHLIENDEPSILNPPSSRTDSELLNYLVKYAGRPKRPWASWYTLIPSNARGLIKVDALGYAFAVLPVGLLRKLPSEPFALLQGCLSEDTALSIRLRIIGARLFVNMEVKVGHLDGRNDHIYFSYKPPMRLIDGQLVEAKEPALPPGVHQYGLPFEAQARMVEAAESRAINNAVNRVLEHRANKRWPPPGSRKLIVPPPLPPWRRRAKGVAAFQN